MTTLKKLSLSAAMLALGIGVAGQASALCTVYGSVHRAYVNDAEGSQFYVIPRTGGMPTFNYWFRVSPNAPVVRDLLMEAQSSGDNVWIRGNAGSCPTSGTYRYGGYATIAQVYELL